jgi:hypothetical protein
VRLTTTTQAHTVAFRFNVQNNPAMVAEILRRPLGLESPQRRPTASFDAFGDRDHTLRESKLSERISRKYKPTGLPVPSDAFAALWPFPTGLDERAVGEFVRWLFVHSGPLGSFEFTSHSGNPIAKKCNGMSKGGARKSKA